MAQVRYNRASERLTKGWLNSYVTVFQWSYIHPVDHVQLFLCFAKFGFEGCFVNSADVKQDIATKITLAGGHEEHFLKLLISLKQMCLWSFTVSLYNVKYDLSEL